MVDYAGLISQVQSATGPDPVLAQTLATELNVPGVGDATVSIDAAVAFLLQLLPGWGCDMMQPDTGVGPGPRRAIVFKTGVGVYWAEGCATVPLTIVLAMLRALQANA